MVKSYNRFRIPGCRRHLFAEDAIQVMVLMSSRRYPVLAYFTGNDSGPAFEGATEIVAVVKLEKSRNVIIAEATDLQQVERHVLAHMVQLFLKPGVMFFQRAFEGGRAHRKILRHLLQLGRLPHAGLQTAEQAIQKTGVESQCA